MYIINRFFFFEFIHNISMVKCPFKQLIVVLGWLRLYNLSFRYYKIGRGTDINDVLELD